MFIDFHCHVKLAKAMKFDPAHLLKLVHAAQRQGLDAIALTEHIYTSDFLEIYKYLDENFVYENDCYQINGLKVFAGIEIDVKEFRGHVLAIGNRDDVKAIAAYVLSGGSVPSFEEVLDCLDDHSVIKIGAHPFRPGRPLSNLDGSLLKRLDFLELNARDIRERKQLDQLLEKLQMRKVGGSDTHHPFQLGCVTNELLDDCKSIGQLRQCLQNNRYLVHVSQWIHVKRFIARTLKRYLKKKAARKKCHENIITQ